MVTGTEEDKRVEGKTSVTGDGLVSAQQPLGKAWEDATLHVLQEQLQFLLEELGCSLLLFTTHRGATPTARHCHLHFGP